MRYLYLALAGLECLAALIVYWLRPDLRRTIVVAGLAGGFVESISELWYLRDYWRPLTLLPIPTVEDFFYGFGVTALAVCAVPFCFAMRYVDSMMIKPRLVGLSLGMSGVGFAIVMTASAISTSFNTLTAAALYFLLLGVFGCWIRPKLLLVGISAGLIMGLMALVGYWIGLNHLIDGQAFLNRILVDPGGRTDIRVFGQVPLDEVIWNTTRGFCVAVMYPVLTGTTLAKLAPS